MAAGGPGHDPITDIVRYGVKVFSPEADLLIAEIVALGGEQELRDRYGAFYWGPPSFAHELDSLRPISPDFVAELSATRDQLERQRRLGGWEVDRLLAEARKNRPDA